MIDEGSDDQGHASADEIEEGAENMMTEAVQKEKRTKKRHDRPSASEEDQNPAKPAKRLKTRASKPKELRVVSVPSSLPLAFVFGISISVTEPFVNRVHFCFTPQPLVRYRQPHRLPPSDPSSQTRFQFLEVAC
ncbi:hypothetical protein P8452_76125 [Trifolium repens]|nr:hypothetical protein P8452_76125 [Trifolium repens]